LLEFAFALKHLAKLRDLIKPAADDPTAPRSSSAPFPTHSGRFCVLAFVSTLWVQPRRWQNDLASNNLSYIVGANFTLARKSSKILSTYPVECTHKSRGVVLHSQTNCMQAKSEGLEIMQGSLPGYWKVIAQGLHAA
jgi:hypothetical protein